MGGGSIGPSDVILVILACDTIESFRQKIEQKYPGTELRWFNERAADDTQIALADIPAEVWDGVTVLCSFRIPSSADLVPRLRFVQLSSAGSNHCSGSPLFGDPTITFCTSNGIHAPQIAEWVIGTWLMHQHQFVRFEKQRLEEYWEKSYENSFEDSTGLRMGILGYGAIGRQCARLAKSLGMDVMAFTMRERKTAESRKDDSYCVPGTGDPDGLIPSKWFHGTDRSDMNEFLNQGFDILVLCLPLTSISHGIIGKEQFEILKKRKTFLSNVGRGPLVDTEDLVDALESGKIRGAALDVTEPEPLPKGHPLWKAPNVFITPHISWRTNLVEPRLVEVLEKNLENLDKGMPLINRIDRSLNY